MKSRQVKSPCADRVTSELDRVPLNIKELGCKGNLSLFRLAEDTVQRLHNKARVLVLKAVGNVGIVVQLADAPSDVQVFHLSHGDDPGVQLRTRHMKRGTTPTVDLVPPLKALRVRPDRQRPGPDQPPLTGWMDVSFPSLLSITDAVRSANFAGCERANLVKTNNLFKLLLICTGEGR